MLWENSSIAVAAVAVAAVAVAVAAFAFAVAVAAIPSTRGHRSPDTSGVNPRRISSAQYVSAVIKTLPGSSVAGASDPTSERATSPSFDCDCDSFCCLS